jgi:hypothetical protein
MNHILSNQFILKGRWQKSGHDIIEDNVAKYITILISTHLNKIAESDDGWSHLYQDPVDRRLWELLYENREWHGGGPPTLRNVSINYAATKYGYHNQ